ncbi:unnamed protein product [Ectocarpus sp. CCAP 1310/34]|nr:unnamed protein product [Ectocarpus sp. CCAP 1310/34]
MSRLRALRCPSLLCQVSALTSVKQTAFAVWVCDCFWWGTRDFVPDGWTFCSNVMSRVHMPWSRGSCVSGITLPWIVRCGVLSSTTQRNPFFRREVGKKMLRQSPGTLSP